MGRGPQGVDRLDECIVLLVGHNVCCVPACAPVHHVEDDKLVDKEQVTLHLLVELVWKTDTACIAWSRLGPLSTYPTRLDNLGNQAQDLV